MAASASLGLTLTMIEEIPATNTGLAGTGSQVLNCALLLG